MPTYTPPDRIPAVPGRWRRPIIRLVLALAVLFALIQLVPYGRGGNPPVTRAASWPPGVGQELAKTACYDCHSNLTNRWWATQIAPASWLAQTDVSGGRSRLNFSTWDTAQPDAKEVADTVLSGSMPPLQYTLIHRNARLSVDERAQLAAAVTALYATDPPASIRRGEG